MPFTTKEQAQFYAADPVSVELTPYDLVQLLYLTREHKDRCAENAVKWSHYAKSQPETPAHNGFFNFWKSEEDYFSDLLAKIEFHINPQNRKK